MTQKIIFDGLSNIRDKSPVSSRNTTKSALLKEVFSVFEAVEGGLPLNEVRKAIVNGKIFQKTSFETRRKIGDLIFHRYLGTSQEWIGHALAKATLKGSQSPEFQSLAYLYFCLRDRLVFDFVTGPLWEKWLEKSSNLTKSDFLAFLEKQAEVWPQINRWRESTRDRLAFSDLASLRDFGLLKGVQKKSILRPTIAPETVYHLLCILMAEGLEGRLILEAKDWHLFLWNELEVVEALGDLAQRGWINFEKTGRIVILGLIRQPEITGEKV